LPFNRHLSVKRSYTRLFLSTREIHEFFEFFNFGYGHNISRSKFIFQLYSFVVYLLFRLTVVIYRLQLKNKTYKKICFSSLCDTSSFK
jgi:hypothetical protein